jgi:ParB family chromosome partitioning protein
MTEVKTVMLGELEHDPAAIDGHEARLKHLDDLMASIPIEGQLQSLTVRRFTGEAPKKGKAPVYWVTAGNRRLATLRKLRDTKATVLGQKVTDAFPVHVVIKDQDAAAAYASSRAENLMRLPETPVEEFRAFAKMATTMKPKEIAARFGITEKRVKQRLTLAALHPDVLSALDAGKISMEAAQAFTIEPQQKKQADYLKKNERQSWMLEPRAIKQAFTEKLIRGDSAIAKLVGKKEYLAAGGKIHGDAFDDKASFWISPAVIDTILASRNAEQIKSWLDEGWLFVETAGQFGAGSRFGDSAVFYATDLEPVPVDMPEADKAEFDKLVVAIDALEAANPGLGDDFDWDAWEDAHHGEDDPEISQEIRDQHSELTTRATALSDKAEKVFTAEQKAHSGVVYWPDGSIEPHLGVVKPGTKLPESLGGGTGAAAGGTQGKPEASLDAPGPTMVKRLSEQMTEALRAKVEASPDLALRVLVATLRCQARTKYGRVTPLRITSSHVDEEEGEEKVAELPMADAFVWASAMTNDDLMIELAKLVAANISLPDVDYMQVAPDERKQALVDFVDPDVYPHFDHKAYFGGLTKPLIAQAYRQFADHPIGDGKKDELATAAAAMARNSRHPEQTWLPPQLRTPSYRGPKGDGTLSDQFKIAAE